jgi:hypothetical protein
MTRGQSNVVGVALLLGIAVISMGVLTAAIGVVIDSSATEADAERVADDFGNALEPVGTTGPQRGTVTFSEGLLRSVDRRLEIRADGEIVATIAVDALVFEADNRRVAFHAGAIVRAAGDRAWMVSPPLLTIDEDVIIIGAARLGRNVGSASGAGGVTATIETDVDHSRRPLGEATFSLAIETAAPAAWEAHLGRQGATVRREPGDPPTVVATFEGDRTGYLVVHDLDTEVHGRG